MNKIYKLALTSCLCVFVSSCAYEPDRGRPLRDGNANTQEKDVLKGKTNPEILNLKYESLSLTCSLMSEIETPEGFFESKITTPPQPEEPGSPVKNEGLKTTFDLKAQLAIDPNLKEEQKDAKMELVENDRKLNVDLIIKPVVFFQSLNMKHESSVFIMKHSPALTISYAYTLSVDERNSFSSEGRFKEDVHEGVPFKGLITSEKMDGKIRNYYAVCDLKGTIKKDNPGLSDQWLRIDCSKPAEPGRENLHQKNCHGGKPIPDTI